MRFSQRHGYAPVKDAIQRETADVDVRVALWNVLDIFFWNSGKGRQQDDVPSLDRLVSRIWSSYFKRPLDTMSHWFPDNRAKMRSYFFGCPWHEVYDFIEFVGQNAESGDGFTNACNAMLEREMAAYRLVGGRITEITSGAEIKEIESALAAGKGPLAGVRTHLNAALALLSDRKNPDYRNSIKESISAVETTCKVLTGQPKTTLGPALAKLGASAPLHGAFEEALRKLYGYTSDAQGIRHALMDEPSLEFEDAKFMLVSCSAFVNYLIAKAGRAGLSVN